jgi:Uncharacterized conserved protein (DUF2304)
MSVMLPIAAEGELQPTVQIVAVVVTAVLLLAVLELVRRRQLSERYALLWMTVALFLAAFGVAFLLLLHFSVANSRLGEETKILAQEVARLDELVRSQHAVGSNGKPRGGDAPDGAPRDPGASDAQSSARTTDQ